MRPETRQRLLDLSARFYETHGATFDATRSQPWPGWSRLWELAPAHFADKLACLDAGCGNGRFLDFLGENGSELRYVGVDTDRGLLYSASDKLENMPFARSQVTLRRIDLVREGTERLSYDAPFDLVVLFGVLHHVPDEAARRRLLMDLGRLTRPQGLLVASIWRLDQDTERFARKIVPWSEWNETQPEAERVDPSDLDEGDVLLSWRGDRSTPRYGHFPTNAEIERLADLGPEMELVERFEADGPTGHDNLYLVWRRDPATAPCYPPPP